MSREVSTQPLADDAAVVAAALAALPDRVTPEGRLGPRSAVGATLQPTLAELSVPGRHSDQVPHPAADALAGIPASQLRASPAALPELNEPSVIRHFVNLSRLNYSVDGGLYPLGSCTMKYNPKVNEWAARLPGFAALHPLAPDEVAQGSLELLWELQGMLAEITGMQAVTLQPAAGAQGELTGILLIRAWHRSRGDLERQEVIVPDSSHGTNPATASMAGFRTVTVPSAPDGGVDLDALRAALGPRTAAVMLTNPSTLGLFERRITELLDAVHGAGALAYMDGANMNAVMGRFKPGEAGFDVMHSQPPQDLLDAARRWRPRRRAGRGRRRTWRRSCPRRWWFATGTAASAWSGRMSARRRSDGCAPTRATWACWCVPTPTSWPTAAAACARSAMMPCSPPTTCGRGWARPSSCRYAGPCKHEFVATARALREATGVRTLDVAKRLIDYGFHPPTIYFPLIVEECLLIEPTETESVEDARCLRGCAAGHRARGSGAP